MPDQSPTKSTNQADADRIAERLTPEQVEQALRVSLRLANQWLGGDDPEDADETTEAMNAKANELVKLLTAPTPDAAERLARKLVTVVHNSGANKVSVAGMPVVWLVSQRVADERAEGWIAALTPHLRTFALAERAAGVEEGKRQAQQPMPTLFEARSASEGWQVWLGELCIEGECAMEDAQHTAFTYNAEAAKLLNRPVEQPAPASPAPPDAAVPDETPEQVAERMVRPAHHDPSVAMLCDQHGEAIAVLQDSVSEVPRCRECIADTLRAAEARGAAREREEIDNAIYEAANEADRETKDGLIQARMIVNARNGESHAK